MKPCPYRKEHEWDKEGYCAHCYAQKPPPPPEPPKQEEIPDMTYSANHSTHTFTTFTTIIDNACVGSQPAQPAVQLTPDMLDALIDAYLKGQKP